MACILNIETSTRVCSVALSLDGQCIYSDVDKDGPSHSVSCGVFVQNALSFANSHAIPVDAVAVSRGPGSYTGLRIGYSMAKGVAYGYGIPLINVDTLSLLCVPVLLKHCDLPDDALLVPMIDARRMEVYSAVYDRSLSVLRGVQADVVAEGAYSEYSEQRPVYYFGDGSDKCVDVLNREGMHHIPGILPLASNMYPLSERAFLQKQYADVAYDEPFYLKEFQATRSKNLLQEVMK